MADQTALQLEREQGILNFRDISLALANEFVNREWLRTEEIDDGFQLDFTR